MYIYIHLSIHTYITFHYITSHYCELITWHDIYICIYIYIYMCARESVWRYRHTQTSTVCVHVPPLNTKSKAGPLLDRGLLPAQSFFELKILSCWLRSRSSQTSRNISCSIAKHHTKPKVLQSEQHGQDYRTEEHIPATSKWRSILTIS